MPADLCRLAFALFALLLLAEGERRGQERSVGEWVDKLQSTSCCFQVIWLCMEFIPTRRFQVPLLLFLSVSLIDRLASSFELSMGAVDTCRTD